MKYLIIFLLTITINVSTVLCQNDMTSIVDSEMNRISNECIRADTSLTRHYISIVNLEKKYIINDSTNRKVNYPYSLKLQQSNNTDSIPSYIYQLCVKCLDSAQCVFDSTVYIYIRDTTESIYSLLSIDTIPIMDVGEIDIFNSKNELEMFYLLSANILNFNPGIVPVILCKPRFYRNISTFMFLRLSSNQLSSSVDKYRLVKISNRLYVVEKLKKIFPRLVFDNFYDKSPEELAECEFEYCVKSGYFEE